MKKLIIAVLAVVIVGASYYLYTKKIGEYGIVDAEFTGYFTKRDYNDFGNVVQCNAFVVIDSEPSELADYFKNLARNGNSINQLDNDGNVIVTLDFDETRQFEDKIIASTKTNPIKLSVQKLPEREQGALACHSPILILGIE